MYTKEEFDLFMKQIETRMDKGRLRYGDYSFKRYPSDILNEVSEELLDVCGWSFVMWKRIRDLRTVIGDVEASIHA